MKAEYASLADFVKISVLERTSRVNGGKQQLQTLSLRTLLLACCCTSSVEAAAALLVPRYLASGQAVKHKQKTTQQETLARQGCCTPQLSLYSDALAHFIQ